MRSSFHRFIFASVLTISGLGPVAYAEEGEADGGPLALSNFSVTLWVSNEYMFRGISNTDGVTGQGSFDWTYSGLYLGAWASNTEFSDNDIEVDFYGGYRGALPGGIAYDIGGLYYWFPGEDENFTDSLSDGAFDPGGGQEAHYAEFQIILSKAIDVVLSPTIAAKYNYSPDFFGEDGSAHAVQGDLGITVPMGFLGDVGISGTVGYQDVDGDNFTPGYDYVWWRAGVYKVLAGFKLDLSYHATDLTNDLKAVYPNPSPGVDDFRDLIEPHFVVTLSRTFTLP